MIAGLGTLAGIEADLPPLAAAYVLVLAILGPVLARMERAPGFLARRHADQVLSGK
ncbi:MAG: hypothetical protein M5U19_00285 [Microthrixaceae bacterium]|nr:hypothetical protein [Microthrixaceae bacterium]